MVLMALVDLGRRQVGRATRWLWLLLSGGLWVGVQEGCFDPDEHQGDSGPPPAHDVLEDSLRDTTPQDVPATDLPSVDAPEVPDVPKDCGMMTYYGPQPCETDEECAQREGAGWYCDTANVFEDGCGGQVHWPMCRPGDVPVDAVTPDVPADTPPDCMPMVAYGPPPCNSDADCQAWGEGWICDKEHPITDPCSGTWYMCQPAPADVPPQDAEEDASIDAIPPDAVKDVVEDCPAIAYYGPPPCQSDADCEMWYGEGYACNKDATLPDGCGGQFTFPTCEPKAP